MTLDKVRAVQLECERVLLRVRKVLETTKVDKTGTYKVVTFDHTYTAALRRASLDLTKALAAMRKTEQ